MKYALMAEITLNTKAKRDRLSQSVKDSIIGKVLWADKHNPTLISEKLDEDGKPYLGALMRFDNKDDRDEIALLLENEIVRIPALSGSVSVHKCWHDMPEANRPCETETI